MNILCNQTNNDLSHLRINRRILDPTKSGLSKTFINNNKNDELPISYPERQPK
jgi:hypothetical protein